MTLGRAARAVGAEFGDIVVRQQAGHAVQLRDVGTVEDSMAEAETKASLNGEPTVLLTIRRQSGTNTVAVVDAVKERLADLAPLVPPGYEIRVVRDLSEFIKASIDSVEEHLIFGSILAAAVVLVFLELALDDHRGDALSPSLSRVRPDLYQGLRSTRDGLALTLAVASS